MKITYGAVTEESAVVAGIADFDINPEEAPFVEAVHTWEKKKQSRKVKDDIKSILPDSYIYMKKKKVPDHALWMTDPFKK